MDVTIYIFFIFLLYYISAPGGWGGEDAGFEN